MRKWQADALLEIPGDPEFLLLNCTNTRYARHVLRHGLYYLLNIVALRTGRTRHVEIPATVRIVERIDFESEWEGAWQRLPPAVLRRLSKDRTRLALKFGMGLLRVPRDLQCKILSYHHGDPSRFRGRPAGFYELFGDAGMVGQIVQVISNRLDSGSVVAFAETRVHRHSYRATMEEAYRVSPLLMQRAVANSLSDVTLPIVPEGKNFRLPSNWSVVAFSIKLLLRKLKRLLYGAFYYKSWNVAAAEFAVETKKDLIECIADATRWRVFPRPQKYDFLADPFPHPREGILVEALRRSDGQGEIVHLHGQMSHVLCTGAGHFSYPATIQIDHEWFILPEVSEWTSPRVYRLTESSCQLVGTLEIDGMPRLADATIFSHASGLFLFGTKIEEGAGVLRLWTSQTLFGRFSEHPDSPIRISPSGSRMAGAILERNGRLYRFGQDFSRAYGDGIVAFEITALSFKAYGETPIAELRFAELRGPHTLNFKDNCAYFDFYRERFTPLAGLRRIRAAISKHAAFTPKEMLPK